MKKLIIFTIFFLFLLVNPTQVLGQQVWEGNQDTAILKVQLTQIDKSLQNDKFLPASPFYFLKIWCQNTKSVFLIGKKKNAYIARMMESRLADAARSVLAEDSESADKALIAYVKFAKAGLKLKMNDFVNSNLSNSLKIADTLNSVSDESRPQKAGEAYALAYENYFKYALDEEELSQKMTIKALVKEKFDYYFIAGEENNLYYIVDALNAKYLPEGKTFSDLKIGDLVSVQFYKNAVTDFGPNNQNHQFSALSIKQESK